MYHTFDFISHQDDYVFDEQYVFLSAGGCRLRRHDTSFNYDPAGIFEESTVELPNIEGTAVRTFTGLFVEAAIQDGTALGYQISEDGGTVWQWYDGAVWQTAGSSDWSTITQIDAGISLLEGHQLKVKILLTPNSDEELTPHIGRVHVFYEATWSYFEDLKRSAKKLIDETLVVNLVWAKETGSGSVTVVIDTNWTVQSVSAAYDITDDPGRLVNLYSSYDSSTKTVILSAAIPAGNEVEIHFAGGCNTFLAADENLQVSEVPAVVLVMPRAREDKYASKNLFEYEPLIGKGVVRRRERTIQISSTIMLHAIGPTEVDSLALNDALAEIFEPEPTFSSVAVGEDFFCLTYEPLIDNDMVSTGLHVKMTQILVLGNKDLRSFTDVPPVTVIGTELVGAGMMRELNDPVHVESLIAPPALLNPICDTLPSEKGDIDE